MNDVDRLALERWASMFRKWKVVGIADADCKCNGAACPQDHGSIRYSLEAHDLKIDEILMLAKIVRLRVQEDFGRRIARAHKRVRVAKKVQR